MPEQACFFKGLGAPGECRGPEQLCHLIERAELRRERIDASLHWAPAIVRLGCEFHHSLYDRRLWQMQLDQYPDETRRFAEEIGFGWYGPRRRWRRDHSVA